MTGSETVKIDVRGTLVKLLYHRRLDRGMTLIPEQSRCVRAGEVHELVTTDQDGLRPGDRVDRVGFLGFVEISGAGVLDVGDRVVCDGAEIGKVVGFDACHFPNHYNVLIGSTTLHTGDDLGLRVGRHVDFRSAGRTE